MDWGELLGAGLDVDEVPPTVLPYYAGFVGLEAAGINLMLSDLYQEEPFTMALEFALPLEEVIAGPHWRGERCRVNYQSRLLGDLTNQSFCIGLAGLHCASRREPPGRTPPEFTLKEQNPP